jgi:DNA-binding response OmpR family regulator
MKILVVDDESPLRGQLRQLFEAQRYSVETAADGAEALDRIFDSSFDLIVLDIMMPGLDGYEVLGQTRKAGIKTPVLMLTARGDVEDKVKGLDLGADDYLEKPFSMDELLARVRAMLRRTGTAAQSMLGARDLQLDTATRKVSRGGVPVELTPREFAILEFLLYNRNRVVSRFSLAEHVWGDDYDPFSMSNFMDVHIKNLRRKIGDSGENRIVKTVRGIGYIIENPES